MIDMKQTGRGVTCLAFALAVASSASCLAPGGTQCAQGVHCPAGYACVKPDRVSAWECVLASCGDGIVDEGERYDDGNDVSGDGCDPTCTLGDLLTPEILTANAILSNPEANQRLIDSRLEDATFDAAMCDGGGACLNGQLLDPWARHFMAALVACALPGDGSVEWRHPRSGSRLVWHGSRGLCPGWADEPIAGDGECRELITACLLARASPLGLAAPLSFRGVVGERKLELESEVPAVGYGGPYWSSLGSCQPAATVQLDVECGDSAGDGDNPDSPLEHDPNPPVTPEVILWACDGSQVCDQQASLVTMDQACGDSNTFTCGDTGRFVVRATEDPSVFQLSEPVNAAYPLGEDRVFDWMEGALTRFAAGATTR